eukprot:8795301-Pyramimonas_sp.AAC.1
MDPAGRGRRLEDLHGGQGDRGEQRRAPKGEGLETAQPGMQNDLHGGVGREATLTDDLNLTNKLGHVGRGDKQTSYCLSPAVDLRVPIRDQKLDFL